MKRILFILTSVLLLAACEKQSELVIQMGIDNASWEQKAVESGTNLHLNITAESQNSTIRRIILTSGDVQYKDRTILDTLFTEPLKKVQLSHYYLLPYYTDTTKVKLTARAYDQLGNTMSYAIPLMVAGKDVQLRVLDLVTLYSAGSEGKSAFSFETYQPVYLGSDSSAVAFFDVLDSTKTDSPSCIWHSESGIQFTRSEGFNFSEATLASLPLPDAWQQNYVKSNTIKDLKTDDILLFGTKNEVYGVLKMISIYDDPGSASDRYLFSMKVIPE